jgi:hypothetical protein
MLSQPARANQRASTGEAIDAIIDDRNRGRDAWRDGPADWLPDCFRRVRGPGVMAVTGRRARQHHLRRQRQ